MKKLIPFLLIALSFSGCQVIGDIFKAGVWTGFLIVAVVIFAIIWLFTRIGKK